ncbi:MAG: hypothetical protein QOE06_3039 [Thermoleophilaceae bacterium]|nr:hypothetical protein [Thermoleophilaceae bacterium]
MPTRVALVVLAILAGWAIAPLANAATVTDRDVALAFAHLRSQVRHAGGLDHPTRRSFIATVHRAEDERTVNGSPCAALTVLEELRGAVRRSPAGKLAGIDDAERAILGTRAGRPCAYRSRQVRLVPPLTAGPGQPLPHVNEKKDEERGMPALSAPPGANRPDPGPPTTVTPVPAGGSGYASPGSDPFAITGIKALSSPVETGYPSEPSQASAGDVVWYTGNSGAAFSLDGGATFKQVDPRRMFFEGNTPFCCDQVVVYAPQIDRFIWLMQYWCPAPDEGCNEGHSNVVRLASASPSDIVKNRRDPGSAWQSWVLAPDEIGMRRDIFDYPALAVGRHSLYITSNMFGQGENDVWSLVGRVNLDAIKKGHEIGLNYVVDRKHFSYEPAQGVDRRGFIASHQSDTELFTLSWDEGSPLLFPHRTKHALSAAYDYYSPTGAGDWGDRSDWRIAGATLQGNEVWFAWSEGRATCLKRCETQDPKLDPFWPQPHVHVVAVDTSSFGLTHDRFIHNPDYAISYPELATDALGQVGMTFSYGGGTAGNPSPAAGFLTGGEAFRQVASSPSAGDQGDFFSIRPDWPDATRFTASGYVSDGYDEGGDPLPRWIFYRFAR